MEIPGLPGGSIIYQGHQFSKKDTYVDRVHLAVDFVLKPHILRDVFSRTRGKAPLEERVRRLEEQLAHEQETDFWLSAGEDIA